MKRKGFTLIELMVVIAIILILAATLTPYAFNQIEKSKVARTESELSAFKSAVLQYYADLGQMPNYWGTYNDPGFVTNRPVPGRLRSLWRGPYLEKWPYQNPFGGSYRWYSRNTTWTWHGYTWDKPAMVDVRYYNPRTRTSNPLPMNVAVQIDRDLDDGNLRTGRVGNTNYDLYVLLGGQQR